MTQGALQSLKQVAVPLDPKPRITVNLMDVSFLEQNLQSILEVSRRRPVTSTDQARLLWPDA